MLKATHPGLDTPPPTSRVAVTAIPQGNSSRMNGSMPRAKGDIMALAEGLNLSWAQVHTEDPLRIERQVPTGILMSVTLAGEMHTQSRDGRWTMRNQAGHANLALMQEPQPLRSDFPAGGNFAAVSLLLPFDWLDDSGSISLGVRAPTSTLGILRTGAPFATRPTRALLATAWQLLHPPHTGKLAALYRQSRGIDLLFGLLDTFSTQPASPVPIRGTLIERLHHAREILDARLDDPPSLDELARAIGTNVRALKQGFKACFGVTVFGYVFEQRMQLARRLLESEGVSVALVAQQVGYGASSNFATAFRRRFGLPPSAMTRR